MQLRFEDHGLHATSFDLDMTFVDDIYEYKIIDKRENYPFFIVRIPIVSGNIPARISRVNSIRIS